MSAGKEVKQTIDGNTQSDRNHIDNNADDEALLWLIKISIKNSYPVAWYSARVLLPIEWHTPFILFCAKMPTLFDSRFSLALFESNWVFVNSVSNKKKCKCNDLLIYSKKKAPKHVIDDLYCAFVGIGSFILKKKILVPFVSRCTWQAIPLKVIRWNGYRNWNFGIYNAIHGLLIVSFQSSLDFRIKTGLSEVRIRLHFHGIFILLCCLG